MRYFAGFLLAIALLILVFVLIIKGFGGHSGSEKPPIVLSDYAHTGVVMQITIDGPLVADTNHVGFRVTIGQTQNTIQTYRGYQNEETSSKTYPNNANAYDQFLRALQFTGFTKGNSDPARADERGVCAGGFRYIYRIISESGADIQRWWSSSCGAGNFTGNPEAVRALFRAQIPDYSTVVSKLNF